MRKRVIAMLLLCVSLLSGCGKEEEVQEPVVEPDLHEIVLEYNWDGLDLKGITPVSSFEADGENLNIYPYYNNDAHISMRKIFISSNNFWSTVEKVYSEGDNYIKREKYSYVTFDNQNTVCYIPIDEETAYVIESSTLPSGYIDLFARMFCSIST